MEFLLNRFRNLTVLVVVILAQLVLLAYQVKSSQDVPLIRVWAVTAVTPVARMLEALRSGTVGLARDYIFLRDVRDENRRLNEEIGQLKLRNLHLSSELDTLERTRGLYEFRSRTPSRTIAARIIMSGTGANSKVVFLNRGSASGVMRGMAVITGDGIVGKVVNAYPTASQVLLATDPSFAAGVISQKNRVHGTLKGGMGRNTCIVDHVQNEEKVEVGEWFYTSGDDRVFPKGLPAGQVKSVREGRTLKEIQVEPVALAAGLEEVLIVLEGVHQPIPDPKTASTATYVMPPPPAEPGTEQTPPPSAIASGTAEGGVAPAVPATQAPRPRVHTDADRLLERYQRLGESQGHIYGKPGTRPPEFNADPNAQRPQPSAPRAKPGDTTTGTRTSPAKPPAPRATPGDTPTGAPVSPAKPPEQKKPVPAPKPTDPQQGTSPTPQ